MRAHACDSLGDYYDGTRRTCFLVLHACLPAIDIRRDTVPSGKMCRRAAHRLAPDLSFFGIQQARVASSHDNLVKFNIIKVLSVVLCSLPDPRSRRVPEALESAIWTRLRDQRLSFLCVLFLHEELLVFAHKGSILASELGGENLAHALPHALHHLCLLHPLVLSRLSSVFCDTP